jgi:hypothetical protein
LRIQKPTIIIRLVGESMRHQARSTLLMRSPPLTPITPTAVFDMFSCTIRAAFSATSEAAAPTWRAISSSESSAEWGGCKGFFPCGVLTMRVTMISLP